MGASSRLVGIGVSLALLAGLATPGRAATVAYLTDAQLAARSSRIVQGTVANVWSEIDRAGVVRTIARLEVAEDLTGVDETFIDIEILGGVVGETALIVPGSPTFEKGGQVVACLEPSRRAGRWRLVTLGASLFALEANGSAGAAAGRARLRRRDEGLHVLGRPSREGRARTLDEFRRAVRRARGVDPVRPRRRGAKPPVPPGDQVMGAAETGIVSANFTLLGGGVRWNEADTGATITWYRNLAAAAPVDGSTGDPEILTGLAAWTMAPGTRIPLAYGGGRDIGTDSPWCGPSHAGAGLISFEDPTNEMSTGVIALGGGCTSSVGRKTVNGTVFDSFTHGFVVLNRSAEVGPTYRTPLNFGRIIEHELGHGIGLGHTPTALAGATANIMYPSCCYASTPVPPALGPDDLAGVRFIYPPSLVPGDADGDGLVDSWEVFWGLDPSTAAGIDGASGDPDGDGRTNLQEQAEGTHPRGFHVYRFAEGAHSRFFFSESHLFVPGTAPARVSFRTVASPHEYSCNVGFELAARKPQRWTPGICMDASWLSRYSTMSSIFESDEPLVAEQTLSWPLDPSGERGTLTAPTPAVHGAHAESAAEAASTTWHFAEGATHSGFDLFFLVYNVEARAVTVTATYLRPAPLPPVVRSYLIEPNARRTIWVDVEEPELSSADLAASFSADGAVVIERSMYRSESSPLFGAGHGARGVASPSTLWWFAEGATGDFFDAFLLLANPGPAEARLTLRFILSTGEVIERPVTVAAESRFTLWADVEDPRLANAEFGVEVRADNGVPVVAERAMWWPGPTPASWIEGHVASGLPAPAQRWVTADGEAGGDRNARTYLLVLNPNDSTLELRVTVVLEDGGESSAPVLVPPSSRLTVDVAALLPVVRERRFAAEVTVLSAGAGVIVERATYWDSAAGPWRAGVAVRATPR